MLSWAVQWEVAVVAAGRQVDRMHIGRQRRGRQGSSRNSHLERHGLWLVCLRMRFSESTPLWLPPSKPPPVLDSAMVPPGLCNGDEPPFELHRSDNPLTAIAYRQ